MTEHRLQPAGGAAAWTQAPDVSPWTIARADLSAAARAELDAAIDGHTHGRPESLTGYLSIAAGDVLLVDNTAILHNRLAYVDTPEPEGRRRLLRGWVRRDHTTIANSGEG